MFVVNVVIPAPCVLHLHLTALEAILFYCPIRAGAMSMRVIPAMVITVTFMSTATEVGEQIFPLIRNILKVRMEESNYLISRFIKTI